MPELNYTTVKIYEPQNKADYISDILCFLKGLNYKKKLPGFITDAISEVSGLNMILKAAAKGEKCLN
jgi:hypothetical protein